MRVCQAALQPQPRRVKGRRASVHADHLLAPAPERPPPPDAETGRGARGQVNRGTRSVRTPVGRRLVPRPVAGPCAEVECAGPEALVVDVAHERSALAGGGQRVPDVASSLPDLDLSRVEAREPVVHPNGHSQRVRVALRLEAESRRLAVEAQHHGLGGAQRVRLVAGLVLEPDLDRVLARLAQGDPAQGSRVAGHGSGRAGHRPAQPVPGPRDRGVQLGRSVPANAEAVGPPPGVPADDRRAHSPRRLVVHAHGKTRGGDVSGGVL